MSVNLIGFGTAQPQLEFFSVNEFLALKYICKISRYLFHNFILNFQLIGEVEIKSSNWCIESQNKIVGMKIETELDLLFKV